MRPAAPEGVPEPAPAQDDLPGGAEHAAAAEKRPGEPVPTRSARRAQRTRSRLEKAALSAFVEVGVGATTIEMITERADLGKGTFYQHFSTQAELLAHLVKGAVNRLLNRISKSVHGLTDIRSTIEAIVNAHLEYFQTNREEFILFFQGHGVVNLVGAAPEDLESSYVRYLEKLEGILKERSAASPGDVPLRRMACAIAGFAFGYLSFAILGLSEENLRDTYRPVRDTLVNGLTALVELGMATPPSTAPGTPPAAAPANGLRAEDPTPPESMKITPP